MNIVLAITHSDLRLALELFLREQPGVDIVGAASESDGLLALVQTTKADMVISEWNLPGRQLLEILPEVIKLSPHPQIMILARHHQDYQTALAAGADAVVINGASTDLLLMTFIKLRNQATYNQEIKPNE